MQHRRVIPPAKGIADFRQTVIGQFLGQRHRYLTRSGHRARATLGEQIRHLDLVILGDRALNIIDADLLVLQCQQILESLADKRLG